MYLTACLYSLLYCHRYSNMDERMDAMERQLLEMMRELRTGTASLTGGVTSISQGKERSTMLTMGLRSCMCTDITRRASGMYQISPLDFDDECRVCVQLLQDRSYAGIQKCRQIFIARFCPTLHHFFRAKVQSLSLSVSKSWHHNLHHT